MKQFGGVIFDFNGVLWWDTHLQEKAWTQYSTLARGTPFTHEELLACLGRPNADNMRYISPEADPATLAEMTRQEQAIYRKLCLDEGENFKLAPGAVELLDYLVAHDIPHTIGTSSDISNVRFFIEQLRLANWFDVDKIVCADGTLRGKPAPDIFLRAAERIGVPPELCIVCEDSKAGFAAARAAGIGKIVALPTGLPEDVIWQQPGVSVVIPDFHAFDRAWLVSE
jgi:beta-phosphoglucomutase-like phosphatase (HAD superfamily)